MGSGVALAITPVPAGRPPADHCEVWSQFPNLQGEIEPLPILGAELLGCALGDSPFQLDVLSPAFLSWCWVVWELIHPCLHSGGGGLGVHLLCPDGWRPGRLLPQGLVAEVQPGLLSRRCGRGCGLALVRVMGLAQLQGRGSGPESASLVLSRPSFFFSSFSCLVKLVQGPPRLSEISLGKCLGLLLRAGGSH